MKAPLLSAFLVLCSSSISAKVARYAPEAQITIINASPSKTGVWWINPNPAEDNMFISELNVNDRMPLNSYTGHDFEVRELGDDQTGECNSKDRTCRITRFTVKSGDQQFFAVNDHFEIEYEDILQPDEGVWDTDDYVSYCKRKSLDGHSAGNHDKELILSRFKSCMANGAGQKLKVAEEEVRFVRNVRQDIGGVSSCGGRGSVLDCRTRRVLTE